MVAGKSSRLLLSSDKLFVCERKALIIVPSIYVVSGVLFYWESYAYVCVHVVIAMVI